MTALGCPLLVVALGGPWAIPTPAAPLKLTLRQVEALWQRLGARETFLESAEARAEPASLYRFFNRQVYDRLRGNPVVGYHGDTGFTWTGKRVAWLGVRPVTPSAADIPPRAWDVAFRTIARKRRWTLDARAPIRIQGACVGAVLQPTPAEPHRGVCVEMRLTSPSGIYWHRFSIAKPTAADAVGAALDWVLCCAQALDPGREQRDAHAPAQP